MFVVSSGLQQLSKEPGIVEPTNHVHKRCQELLSIVNYLLEDSVS